jgi:hypothetical protein
VVVSQTRINITFKRNVISSSSGRLVVVREAGLLGIENQRRIPALWRGAARGPPPVVASSLLRQQCTKDDGTQIVVVVVELGIGSLSFLLLYNQHQTRCISSNSDVARTVRTIRKVDASRVIEGDP